VKAINESQRIWEPATHEDPQDPGVFKKVVVRNDEVDKNSKLMMVNLCKVPVGKTHKAHSHQTMEEIFYFTEGEGEIRIEEEIETVGPGDRVIVPKTHVHQIKNTGNVELKYFGLGIALD
jgi:mannose-6-phosphate isomerase-like protein (cupin superfamily)